MRNLFIAAIGAVLLAGAAFAGHAQAQTVTYCADAKGGSPTNCVTYFPMIVCNEKIGGCAIQWVVVVPTYPSK